MPEGAQYWIEVEGSNFRVMEESEYSNDGSACIDEFASLPELEEWIEGWEVMARDLRAALATFKREPRPSEQEGCDG